MKFSADAATATANQPVDVTIDDVEGCLHRLFIKADGTALRREDKKKAAELVPLLAEVARLTRNRPRGVLVDLCAGKSPLGLLSAALVLQPGWRVVVVDRDAARVDAARRAAIGVDCVVDIVVASVGDDQVHALVATADIVVALHACGAASDAVIDAVGLARPAHLLLVPCCYGAHPKSATVGVPAIPGQALLAGLTDIIPRQGVVGRRLAQAVIDAERTLRLESLGYDVEVVEFVAPTVTPHNLLWRARRGLDERRRAEAASRRHALQQRLTAPSLG